jgi:hypothetical protein
MIIQALVNLEELFLLFDEQPDIQDSLSAVPLQVYFH